MPELTELSSSKHGDWKVASNCAMEVAKSQHIINLKANEVGRAATSFPCFFTHVGDTQNLALSAMTCLELDNNLFVKEGQWQAVYMPTVIQTYPFFLMRSPEDEKKVTVGIDEENPAFSTSDGVALFESEGKAGELLSRATVILEADFKNELVTQQFNRRLQELGLLVPVSVLVKYASGKVNTLTGLHTVDEAKLKALSAEDFTELREKGFLGPIYGLLMSVFQLNALIQRHNSVDGVERIQQVSMEPVEAPAETH